jgi:hypothetical protein
MPKPSKGPKYSKKWTFRQVVKEKMTEKIIQRAKEMAKESRLNAIPLEEAGPSTEDTKGNLDYFRFHPAAWTEICHGLEADTREEYEALAIKWNTEVIPRDIQQK